MFARQANSCRKLSLPLPAATFGSGLRVGHLVILGGRSRLASAGCAPVLLMVRHTMPVTSRAPPTRIRPSATRPT